MKFLLFFVLCSFFCASQQSSATLPPLSSDVAKARIAYVLNNLNPLIPAEATTSAENDIQHLLSRTEASEVQNSPFETKQEKRALEKVLICRSMLIYLKENIQNQTHTGCKKYVKHPSTGKLVRMLEEVDEKVLKEMDVFIARVLVQTALGLHCMPRQGEDWKMYKVRLDISIGGLLLKWD